MAREGSILKKAHVFPSVIKFKDEIHLIKRKEKTEFSFII